MVNEGYYFGVPPLVGGLLALGLEPALELSWAVVLVFLGVIRILFFSQSRPENS